MFLQKSARFNSVIDTAERAIYMFNGQYNPFSHLFADAPQAHVLLRSRNRVDGAIGPSKEVSRAVRRRSPGGTL